ncbi:tRNA-specific 2-thiouridylase MnmA [Alphaproteobacteria bacterium]|nr:tRNA-specific 2-thiouridylase MnmA [Alphaproteobacteria bacterium]
MTKKIRCVVGMSGGVDSAVSTFLMRERGYDVIGCTFRMFDSPGSQKAIADAKQIANFLGVNHEVVECASDFKKHVMDYFVDSYENGLTPNPCIMCNKFLKFHYLDEVRKKFDADFLVTGHYARIKRDESDPFSNIELHRATDSSRDQSYFLYAVDPEILAHAIFPLGEYEKPFVREIAAKNGIHVAQKSDSQDICFIPDKDYVSFIKRYQRDFGCGCTTRITHAEAVSTSKIALAYNEEGGEVSGGSNVTLAGNIVDRDGKVLGKHNGIVNYTIGQRKGLGLSGGPFFVCAIDASRNEIVVSPKENLREDIVHLKDVKFFNGEFLGECQVQVRLCSTRTSAYVCKNADGSYFVKLHTPEFGIAKGQHCVFFDDTKVIGGGAICGCTMCAYYC